MWSTLRRLWHFFLAGFVATFVVYLFIRFDANKVLLGIIIGAAGGLVISVIIFALERRFPERNSGDQLN